MGDPREILQKIVQRKLGRCMIQLQQYEGLLKAMMAGSRIEAAPQDLQAELDKQVADVRVKTLGQLVGSLTGTFLTQAESNGEGDPGGDAAAGSLPDRPWVRMSYTLAMAPELVRETEQGLRELVAMRNELVHHLLERFDLGTEAGCREADKYLDACGEKIEGQLATLRGWTTAMTTVRAHEASWMATQEFEDMLVHGIAPDGTVCWPRSSVVAHLREAENACVVDGWTLLDTAVGLIAAGHPDQRPARYGCKTWRQVLRRSGEFETRAASNPLRGRGETWYRSIHSGAGGNACDVE